MKESTEVTISLMHLQVAFYLLMGGMGMATIAFGVEMSEPGFQNILTLYITQTLGCACINTGLRCQKNVLHNASHIGLWYVLCKATNVLETGLSTFTRDWYTHSDGQLYTRCVSKIGRNSFFLYLKRTLWLG